LIATLLLTGIATTAVGLVPTYNSIGMWGAVLLTLLRLIQGIGVGGKWGGSVLLAMEWAGSTKNRGLLSAWPQFGAPCGLLRLPEQGPGFIVCTFIFTYATTVLGQSRHFVLMAVITQTFIGFIWVVCAGALSDYVGRKNMYMFGAAFMGVFGFIYFAMLNTGIPWVIFVVMSISTDKYRHCRRSSDRYCF
jgi:MFS family permease